MNRSAIVTDVQHKEYERFFVLKFRILSIAANISVKKTQLEMYLYILELFCCP